VGCAAVFAEQLFVKPSKITQGIPIGIFKGFSAGLAESSLRKPIGVRFPTAYGNIHISISQEKGIYKRFFRLRGQKSRKKPGHLSVTGQFYRRN
jgi:hypothetical protein